MLNKLFKALKKTRNTFYTLIHSLNGKKISIDEIELLEEKLLESDMGYETVETILNVIRNTKESDFIKILEKYLLSILPQSNNIKDFNFPLVYMIVGVNGTGKTTSAAKLANFYKKTGYNVTLIAADTYRAAAIDQLKIWADRIDCNFISNKETSDPSSILFDGLKSSKANKSDVIIIDTAGRLHNHENLMKELTKMNNVIKTRFSEFSLKKVITMDANLGQNSITQAEEFNKFIQIDGAIITKLDGTARGGVVFPIYVKLNIPVQFIGYGENLDDLDIFKSEEYVKSFLGINSNDHKIKD